MVEPTAEEKAEKEKKAAEEKAAADKVAAAAAQEDGGIPAAKKEKGGSDEKSPIEEAKEVLTQITEQNKIMSENVEKATKLQAEMMISGKTPAGQGSLSEEEQKDADARKLIEGSGFEDRIFPKKK